MYKFAIRERTLYFSYIVTDIIMLLLVLLDILVLISNDVKKLVNWKTNFVGLNKPIQTNSPMFGVLFE